MTEPTIILVHGLWMTGVEMSLLKMRLRAADFRVVRFQYRMVRKSLDYNVAALAECIRQYAGTETHLIGHSLGGVLALQTLKRVPGLAVAKVICLGSPLTGRAAGRNMAKLGIGRRMVGKTLPEAVFDQPLGEWSGPQPVGVIAGNLGLGIGMLVARLPRPNDGVVTVAETCLPGISDHLVVPVSHTALVLSRTVAEQCAWFLRHGEFCRR